MVAEAEAGIDMWVGFINNGLLWTSNDVPPGFITIAGQCSTR